MSNAFDDATQLSERSNEPHGKQGFTMPKLPERLGIEHHESTDVDGTVLGTHGTTAPVTTNAPTVTPTAAPTITVTPDTAAPDRADDIVAGNNRTAAGRLRAGSSAADNRHHAGNPEYRHDAGRRRRYRRIP